MPAPTDLAAGWRRHWPAAVLVAVGVLVAWWAHRTLFPAYSWNRDEPVYLWQAQAMRDGHIAVSDHGFPGLLRPWLTAQRDGTFFSQYTPGWPAVLVVASVLTGTAASAPLLGAALAVLGIYALAIELFGDRRIAIVAGVLLVASPIFAIQGAVYLSYLFTLGLGLLAGALLLRGLRRDRLVDVAGAGALIGWIFMTRPYDAVLWGVAWGAVALMRHRHVSGWALGRGVVCAVTAVPFVAVTLAYNRHLTGAWLEFPVTAKDPLDTFGFGPRRLMPTFEVVHYDLAKAMFATAKNAFVLPWFLVGGYVGLLTAGLGLWVRRREPSSVALVAIGAVFPLGYFVFWGTYLSSLASRISGPIYFVPLYAPICLATAAILVPWWATRRRLCVALIAALVIGTVPAALSRFEVNRDISVQQEAWQTSVADLDHPSLVFVADSAPYLLFLNPFSANRASLEDRILYATDNGPGMLDLIAAEPGRRPYVQQGSVAAQDSGPREHPPTLDVTLTPIEIRRAPTLLLHIAVRQEPSSTPQQVEVSTEAGTVTRTLPPVAVATQSTVDLEIGPAAVTDLHLAPRGTISVGLSGVTPPERADLVYRQVGGEVEVLTPISLFRFVAVREGRDWRRSTALRSLTVEVRSS